MPGRALKSVSTLDPSRPARKEYIGCGEWCGPLHLVEAAVEGRSYARWFDPDDFMLMGHEDRNGTTITLYKHRDTRHYLNVDAAGRTYGYREPALDADEHDRGSYGPITLIAAMDAVGLWELPWMREELSAERRGYSWENRAKHPDVKAALKRMTPQQRGWAIR